MDVRFLNPEQKRNERLKKRFRVFCLVLCLGYLIVIGRAVALMLKDNEKLETMAMQQYRAAIQKETDRGRILDRRGRELAINVPAWSLYADPKEIKNVSQTSATLSAILKIPLRELKQKLGFPRRFVWIKRRCDAETIEKISKLKLGGIYTLKDNKRFYPNEELAGHVLGMVGIDSQALGGIELGFNRYLTSTLSSGVYLRDARGRLYLSSMPVETENVSGDIYLTLDKNIQFFAEEALREAVKNYGANSGLAIAMDPANGDILAMANEPAFNPNRFQNSPSKNWRNRSVTDIYEPGSTFKTVFVAGALEEGILSPSDRMDCERGSLELPGGHIVNDHHPYDLLTVSEIVKVSSNIGAYKIAKRLGKIKMFEWMEAFGFGSKAGIDFPGESVGLLAPYRQWGLTQEATIAFGQGVGVTPLQMLSAYSAIANGGERMSPHLVEKIVGAEGNILYQSTHSSLGNPIHPETARKLTEMLRGVVQEGGTAPLAEIAEYPVAGKTGTAQKPNPNHRGYAEGKYIASFIGFAPIDNPKLVLLVLIDEPKGAYYGGEVAAPLFRQIMFRSLQYLGLPPEGDKKEVWTASESFPSIPFTAKHLERKGKYFKVPDFEGASLRHVLQAVTPYPVEVEFKGSGVARKQWPKPGSHVLAGGKIYVEFESLY